MTENEGIPECEEKEVHKAALEHIRDEIPVDVQLMRLAELYKVFGDSTRIRILCALMKEELCVCDIAEYLQMTVSAISHQLRTLKQAELVKYRRDGKTVYYSLADEHVSTIIAKGMEHINE